MDRELADCNGDKLAEKFDEDLKRVDKAMEVAGADLEDAYRTRVTMIQKAEKQAQGIIDAETATLAVVNSKIAKLKALYDATPKSNADRRAKIMAKIQELQTIGRRSTDNLLKVQIARPDLIKDQAATTQLGARVSGALNTSLTVGGK